MGITLAVFDNVISISDSFYKLPHTEVKFYPEVKSQTGLSSLRISCKRALRLQCQKSLLVWFIRKKWLAQSRGALNINRFLKAEFFCNCIWFCLIFSFFNDHFLLFILASVAANHKTATELQRVEQN